MTPYSKTSYNIYSKKEPLIDHLGRETILDYSGKAFSGPEFNAFCSTITANEKISTIVLSKKLLTKSQEEAICKLINSNENKGMTLLDETGENFGPLYTNWQAYNEEKREALELGMRETVKMALKCFKGQSFTAIDFGAGTGQDCIPLLKTHCFKVTAIDANKQALEILRANLSKAKLSEDELNNLSFYNGSFIKFKATEQVDLFIASFSWPYRPKDDFPKCWKHTVKLVKAGGIIAGHFFGPKEPEDVAMTYHSEEELKALVEKDFTIIWMKGDPLGSQKIYGGTDAAWGMLYHVVAKKK